MPKLSNAARIAVPRLTVFFLVLSILLSTVGCGILGTHTKVQVPQLLTPLAQANKARLMEEVNRLANLKSVHGKVDIQFEDTSFASAGIAEKYRQVDGTVTLQRPGRIYLIIQFTFVDVLKWPLMVTLWRGRIKGDDKYRRFVKGTIATYPKLDGDTAKPRSRIKTKG